MMDSLLYCVAAVTMAMFLFTILIPLILRKVTF